MFPSPTGPQQGVLPVFRMMHESETCLTEPLHGATRLKILINMISSTCSLLCSRLKGN